MKNSSAKLTRLRLLCLMSWTFHGRFRLRSTLMEMLEMAAELKWCRERIAALEAERDQLLARIEDTDSAENKALKRTVTMCQLELRCIANAVDDPRDNLTLTTAECIEALKKDAERYRWLREKIENDDFVVARVSDWGFTSWSGDDPDRYIDEALAARGDG